MLNTAQSPEMYSAVLKQLWNEAQVAIQAPSKARGHLDKQMRNEPIENEPYPGGAGQVPSAGQIPPAAQRKAGQTYDTPKGKLKWTGTGWVQP